MIFSLVKTEEQKKPLLYRPIIIFGGTLHAVSDNLKTD